MSSDVVKKKQHLELCLDPQLPLGKGSNALDGVHFIPNCLTEIHPSEVSLETSFLRYSIRMPLFISCMTGGSQEGYQLNKKLLSFAQRWRIPVGLGSHRILFRQPELLSHFALKHLAPDVPVFSNIGAVQVVEIPHQDLFEMNKRLEVDAQVVHLNAAQEVMQSGGASSFSGLKEALERFFQASPVPVIVKEVGAGMLPHDVQTLLAMGAHYVDTAGAGGTNWAIVEALRLPSNSRARRMAFDLLDDWGIPSAYTLYALKDTQRVLASGGIRTVSDVVKTLALGAQAVGLARQLISIFSHQGEQALDEFFEDIEWGLRLICSLVGVHSPSLLTRHHLRFSADFLHQCGRFS